MEAKPQDVVATANKAGKPAKMTHDPKITDLNMAVVNEILNGKGKSELAKELGIHPAGVTHHLRRVKELTRLKTVGEITDPINNQRGRLLKRLRKTDTVIGKALRDYGKSDRLSVNASNVAIAVNKGLGVLVDKTEVSGQVDLLAQRRDDMRARLDACRQFGLNPVDELPAVEAEVVDSEVDKVDVSRANTPPEETVNKAETVVNQATIKPQSAPERSQVDAEKAPAKRKRTLSNSKW